MDKPTLTEADERVIAARTSLACRLGALEDRVTGTVETAREAVDETIGTVRCTVKDAAEKARGLVESGTEGLKDVLDVSKQIRQHPWEGAGLAVAIGLIAGLLSNRHAKSTSSAISTAAPPAPSRPSPIREFLDMIQRELATVGETAIKAASSSLKQNVESLITPAPPTEVRMKHDRLQRNGMHHSNGVHADI